MPLEFSKLEDKLTSEANKIKEYIIVKCLRSDAIKSLIPNIYEMEHEADSYHYLTK